MKVIFFGTPEIAIPTLEALIAHNKIDVVAAVTQPDRPSGRGHKLQAPAVKLTCQKHNIPVFQPEKLSKAKEVVEALTLLAPDLIVMVAFGQILKKDILAIPKYGIINLHASLLPAYRGAAPINWALINGDTKTGITTMFTEAGLDTGPMLLKEEIDLDSVINSHELANLVARLGAELTIGTIEQLLAGTLKPQPQDDSKATYAPILTKSLGEIDWSQPAQKIHNLVRGLVPWPLAYTKFRGSPIKIWRTELVSSDNLNLMGPGNNKVGSIIVINKRVNVICGDNSPLEIKEMQPANKQKLSAGDWANGIHIQPSERFEK